MLYVTRYGCALIGGAHVVEAPKVLESKEALAQVLEALAQKAGLTGGAWVRLSADVRALTSPAGNGPVLLVWRVLVEDSGPVQSTKTKTAAREVKYGRAVAAPKAKPVA